MIATTEGILLRDTIRALGFARQGPTPLYEDNTACIEWGNNVIGGRERAKHIDIHKHYAYEAIQLGHARLVRVSTANQLADVLTKGLPPLQHRACIAGIQRRPWPSDDRKDRVPHEEGRIRSFWMSHVGPYEGCLTVAIIQGQSPTQTVTDAEYYSAVGLRLSTTKRFSEA